MRSCASRCARHQEHPAGRGHYHRLCHPRSGGGDGHLRPHRRHEPGRDSARRRAEGHLSAPGESLCRDLHRKSNILSGRTAFRDGRCWVAFQNGYSVPLDGVQEGGAADEEVIVSARPEELVLDAARRRTAGAARPPASGRSLTTACSWAATPITSSRWRPERVRRSSRNR